jgi:D-tyrosyl-tRNA(Tyr) deacylase
VRAVVQRVSEARVRVDDQVVGEIGRGLCVLLGVTRDDESADAERLAGKVARLRIFENEEGKFDRSVQDVEGAVLVVSSRSSPTPIREPGRASRERRHLQRPRISTKRSAPRCEFLVCRSRRACSARRCASSS